MGLSVDYCGEIFTIEEGGELTIGREADIEIDDNPFLHRRFLKVAHSGQFWYLANVGSQLVARVSDENRLMEAWLGPGARIPLATGRTTVVFTAGSSSYDLDIILHQPPLFWDVDDAPGVDDGSTAGRAELTPDQKLMVLALVEAALRHGDSAATTLPTNAEAASRLGWTVKKFERKLDNVCDKLTRLKVRGLHGKVGNQAATRRARLADYALATALVTRDELALLDEPRR